MFALATDVKEEFAELLVVMGTVVRATVVMVILLSVDIFFDIDVIFKVGIVVFETLCTKVVSTLVLVKVTLSSMVVVSNVFWEVGLSVGSGLVAVVGILVFPLVHVANK